MFNKSEPLEVYPSEGCGGTRCSVDMWNPFQTRVKPVCLCSVDRLKCGRESGLFGVACYFPDSHLVVNDLKFDDKLSLWSFVERLEIFGRSNFKHLAHQLVLTDLCSNLSLPPAKLT